MADYYSLIAKAVAGKGSRELRQPIYDRARNALVAQLRSLQPPVGEDVIARENAALDAAIGKIEAGFAGESAVRRAVGVGAASGYGSATLPPPARPAPPPIVPRAPSAPYVAPPRPPVEPAQRAAPA
ncbi:MAG: hypothetical protein KGQ28_07950, partial [Hyphomicrobiales bacterium]|nr:hypothetical protein [Hyphomicrobiales bacterium]